MRDLFTYLIGMMAHVGAFISHPISSLPLWLGVVTYVAPLKSTRMAAVITSLDTGSGNASLEIGTTGMGTILATIALSKPSFTESGGVITMSGVPKSDTSADNTGTAAAARLKSGDGNVIVSGLTVGTSASDINLNSTSITIGQTVTITSGTITHG